MYSEEERGQKASLSLEFYDGIFDKAEQTMMRALVLHYATQFGRIDETEALSSLLGNMVWDQTEMEFKKGFIEAIYSAVSKKDALSDEELTKLIHHYRNHGPHKKQTPQDGGEPSF